MFYKKNLGQEGEKIAIKYLQRLGYTIIEQNFRCKSGEFNIRFDVIEILKKDKIYIRHTRNCEMLALV